MRIETERLEITEMTLDMAMDVHKNSLDEDIRRFVPDDAVIAKAENRNIGYVQLVPIGDGKWEIGYHIAKAYTRNGYATEAVKAFLPVITEYVGVTEVYGIRLQENIASGRVLEKCGFEIFFTGEGPYHDGVFAITKSIWKKF